MVQSVGAAPGLENTPLDIPNSIASRAFVGDRQKARLDAGNTRLAPGDWKSGDHKVIIDVIAPFGGKEKILEEIRG